MDGKAHGLRGCSKKEMDFIGEGYGRHRYLWIIMNLVETREMKELGGRAVGCNLN